MHNITIIVTNENYESTTYDIKEIHNEDLGMSSVRETITVEIRENRELILRVLMKRLPYCCGVIEIGSLYIITDFLKKEGLEESFRTLMSRLLETGFLYMINTIPGQHFFEDYFKNDDRFEMVRVFENPNSDNEITTWISK